MSEGGRTGGPFARSSLMQVISREEDRLIHQNLRPLKPVTLRQTVGLLNLRMNVLTFKLKLFKLEPSGVL